jgi:hypothetical protein
MVFDQCDQDIERSAAESERLFQLQAAAVASESGRMGQTRMCAPPAIDSTGHGRLLNIRRGPADIASNSGKRGWCAWTVLGVFADAKVVRVQVRDAPIGIIDYGVELDACVVGLLAHIKLLN